MLLVISVVTEIVGTFYEKELQRKNETKLRIEKVIKRNGDKLYVKWKRYDVSFNSLIDKKRYSYIKLVIFQNHMTTLKTKKS